MTRYSRPTSLLPPFAFSLLATLIATAAQADSCPAPRTGIANPLQIADRAEQAIQVEADEASMLDQGRYRYRNNVVATKADQVMKADELLYDDNSGRLNAEGNLQLFQQGEQVLTGARGWFNHTNDTGVIENATYTVPGGNGWGQAARVEKRGTYTTRYVDADYSNCRSEDGSWKLHADLIAVNELTGWGTAKGAVVTFRDTPIFYSPYYTFPTDERRKSGWLMPNLKYTDRNGAVVNVPWYWNLAPNQDMTITPGGVSKRGAMLGGEYRYLDTDYQGQLEASFLPDDDLYSNKDRYELKLAHNGALNGLFTYEIDYGRLSDRDYYEDLADSLNRSSVDRLNQRAQLNYQNGQWQASALLSGYYMVADDLDADEIPYKKMPELNLAWATPGRDNRFNYGFHSQWTDFDHSSPTETTGRRSWINPEISYTHTMLNNAAFVRPQVSVAYADYNLDATGNNVDSVQRTTPTYSLQTGLFLDRDLTGGRYRQELEPTLTYTYIPKGRDGDLSAELDHFDSTQLRADENEYLRNNFWLGKDKTSHVDQVTAKVSTHLVGSEQGNQLVTASIAQAYNFVQEERDWSNIVGKLRAALGPHTVEAVSNWDPYSMENDTAHAQYQYYMQGGHFLRAGFLRQRDLDPNDTEDDNKKQAALTAGVKLTPKWNLIGRADRELGSGKRHKLEEMIGVEYETCCWKTSFSRNHHLIDADDNDATYEYDTTWWLMFELKGLGAAGQGNSMDQLIGMYGL